MAKRRNFKKNSEYAIGIDLKEVTRVNKAELIASIAEKSDLTKKDAEKALNAFVASIQEALAQNDKVQLVGFGTFEVRERAERRGRNPQTREEIVIPASKAPVFKAGKALKDAVN
ncbi:MAG: HU family DNA-binding protein [Mahellales bacterium]